VRLDATWLDDLAPVIDRPLETLPQLNRITNEFAGAARALGGVALAVRRPARGEHRLALFFVAWVRRAATTHGYRLGRCLVGYFMNPHSSLAMTGRKMRNAPLAHPGPG